MVNTPFLALGYLDANGAINPFDREAPFRTGDLGRIEQGEMIVSGRRKDSIKKGGEFIALSEIEDLANTSELCLECIAVGKPDIFWGEVYDVRFVPLPGIKAHDAESALIAHFNAHLPQIMRPESVKATDSLPKTASGKLIKQAVDYLQAEKG